MTLADLDAPEPLALSRKHTVVLVDDEPAVLAALRRALRREPYEVRTTLDPVAALEWIDQGDVSLLVTDQRMPGTCGTELAEQVRRISPRTVCVMLTAYPGSAVVQHGLAEELQWLISKPWNDHALRLTLRRLLRDLESTPPPPSTPPTGRSGAAPPEKIRCVEDAAPGLVWGTLQKVIRGAAGAILKRVRWVLGFLWMADAGGTPKS
jgi:CheY-like chemotaxis protein